MFALILPKLAWFYREHPIKFTLFTLVGSLAVLCGFILQYFKPVGKRKKKDGQAPRLPPGPKGIPLLGNLAGLASLAKRKDPRHKTVNWPPGFVPDFY